LSPPITAAGSAGYVRANEPQKEEQMKAKVTCRSARHYQVVNLSDDILIALENSGTIDNQDMNVIADAFLTLSRQFSSRDLVGSREAKIEVSDSE
jgi:BRCT domain type II-containing protein